MLYASSRQQTFKKSAMKCSLFQLEEGTTEAAGSMPAVKPDGFKVPPPPGYKPKLQNAGPEAANIPQKKARGIDKLLVILFLKKIFIHFFL